MLICLVMLAQLMLAPGERAEGARNGEVVFAVSDGDEGRKNGFRFAESLGMPGRASFLQADDADRRTYKKIIEQCRNIFRDLWDGTELEIARPSRGGVLIKAKGKGAAKGRDVVFFLRRNRSPIVMFEMSADLVVTDLERLKTYFWSMLLDPCERLGTISMSFGVWKQPCGDLLGNGAIWHRHVPTQFRFEDLVYAFCWRWEGKRYFCWEIPRKLLGSE
jgi:hypothetical protein